MQGESEKHLSRRSAILGTLAAMLGVNSPTIWDCIARVPKRQTGLMRHCYGEISLSPRQVRQYRITVEKCDEYVRMFGPAMFIDADLRELRDSLIR